MQGSENGAGQSWAHHRVLPPLHLLHRVCNKHASEEAVQGCREERGVAGRGMHICSEEVLPEGSIRGICCTHIAACTHPRVRRVVSRQVNAD